jgi:hypothetical protein
MKMSRLPKSAAPTSRHERLRQARLAASRISSAYPAVLQICLKLEFQDESRSLAEQMHQLNGPSQAFFRFPCPHGDCEGIFDLDSAIAGLVSSAADEAVDRIRCGGMRRARVQHPCGVQLEYRISVEYRA